MVVAAVVPAAGSGLRLGGGIPKAFRLLGGVSLLRRSVVLMAQVADVVLAMVPPTALDTARADLAGLDALVLAGGATRHDSVAAGLRALPAGVDIVLVHDAARPLMPLTVVEAVLAAVRTGAAGAIPVLPVHDTVKTVRDGRVTGTVERADLVSVQTPQGFRRAVLERAHAQADAPATDDAGLVEALGETVLTVPGDLSGLKITTAWDVLVAEMLLSGPR